MILPVSEREFLADYWQKKPLFCPGALPNFRDPISPEVLAGLAMEAPIRSRMVWQHDGIWHQQEGPFSASAFQRIGPWTLLVQGVDHWDARVAGLRDHLPRIPRWRFDDVMVSFATDGAGVGPHFDQYDVFLLQGSGRREWRIGPGCDWETPQLNENGLKLIPPFDPTDTVILQPGDVLYLPPGIAHWGVAIGDCMTYSLGFRAPPVADLIARRTDAVLERLVHDVLLEDRHTAIELARPGEITTAHITNARQAASTALDAVDTGIWFGELVTEPHVEPDQANAPLPPQKDVVRLSPCARVAWIARAEHIDVFVNGSHVEALLAGLEPLIALCGGSCVSSALLNEVAESLYDVLLEHQALTDEEDK